MEAVATDFCHHAVLVISEIIIKKELQAPPFKATKTSFSFYTYTLHE